MEKLRRRWKPSYSAGEMVERNGRRKRDRRTWLLERNIRPIMKAMKIAIFRRKGRNMAWKLHAAKIASADLQLKEKAATQTSKWKERIPLGRKEGWEEEEEACHGRHGMPLNTSAASASCIVSHYLLLGSTFYDLQRLFPPLDTSFSIPVSPVLHLCLSESLSPVDGMTWFCLWERLIDLRGYSFGAWWCRGVSCLMMLYHIFYHANLSDGRKGGEMLSGQLGLEQCTHGSRCSKSSKRHCRQALHETLKSGGGALSSTNNKTLSLHKKDKKKHSCKTCSAHESKRKRKKRRQEEEVKRRRGGPQLCNAAEKLRRERLKDSAHMQEAASYLWKLPVKTTLWTYGYSNEIINIWQLYSLQQLFLYNASRDIIAKEGRALCLRHVLWAPGRRSGREVGGFMLSASLGRERRSSLLRSRKCSRQRKWCEDEGSEKLERRRPGQCLVASSARGGGTLSSNRRESSRTRQLIK